MRDRDRNNILALHEYSLALVRKIKHEMYDLLEQMVLEDGQGWKQFESVCENIQSEASNPQLEEYRFRPFRHIDPLRILERQIFQKYQQQIIQVIQSIQQQSTYQLIQFFDFQTQVTSTQIDQQLQLIDSPKQQFPSPAKQCHCTNNFQLNNNNNSKSQSGHRQLQLLIREKQMNKKLNQLAQELQQTKNLLQEKDLQISKIKKELNSLKKFTEKQNLCKMREEKVRSLKDKIQMESIKREYCLQRERDNLQLMIQKENIRSNQQLISNQTINNTFNSTTKINRRNAFMKRKDSSPLPQNENEKEALSSLEPSVFE